VALPDTVSIIAPCGMNCGICSAYLRAKKKCPGCREESESKSKSCVTCAIKNCEELRNNNYDYCFSCAQFPCARIKHIDKRYRTKYAMSMIENLETIKKSGIQQFIRTETVRWTCPACGGIINVHKGCCHSCGAKT
jgi:hypothetical protein